MAIKVIFQCFVFTYMKIENKYFFNDTPFISPSPELNFTRIYNPVKHLMEVFFAKIVNG